MSLSTVGTDSGLRLASLPLISKSSAAVHTNRNSESPAGIASRSVCKSSTMHVWHGHLVSSDAMVHRVPRHL